MITDYWKDTGTPQDIIHANNVILSDMTPYFDGIREKNVTIENNVMVGKGTIIKEGSVLVGPSIIGENCIIESNTYVGPNTSVGDNSKLSKCDIENSIIMSGCTIEGNLKIRNSIIAFNSEIIKTDNIDENIFLLGEGTKISL
jgi:glucose-1-phosphate thymidylyltransferase